MIPTITRSVPQHSGQTVSSNAQARLRRYAQESPWLPFGFTGGIVWGSLGLVASAVALGAPIRTAAYAFLGTAVLDLSVVQSLAIAGVMILFFVLPLFFPKVRAWLWGERKPSAETS